MEKQTKDDRQTLLNNASTVKGNIKTVITTEKAALITDNKNVGWVTKGTLDNYEARALSTTIEKKGANIQNYLENGVTSSSIAAKFINTNTEPKENEKTISFELDLKSGKKFEQHIPKSTILSQGTTKTENGNNYYFLINKSMADKIADNINNSTNASINNKEVFFNVNTKEQEKTHENIKEKTKNISSAATM